MPCTVFTALVDDREGSGPDERNTQNRFRVVSVSATDTCRTEAHSSPVLSAGLSVHLPAEKLRALESIHDCVSSGE